MLEGKKVIAVIPARGGSKGIPQKNLSLLGNKPLISWPIETAVDAIEIDRVIVSTDDEEIAGFALTKNAEVYMRPKELALDSSLVIDAIKNLHHRLVEEGENDYIMVLLEATSPFRTAELITECLQEFIANDYTSLATFHELEVPAERIWSIKDNKPSPLLEGADPWQPRQKGTPVYILNGCVYVFYPARLPVNGSSLLVGNWGAKIIDNTDIIDIDNEHDLRIANAILHARNIT